jgi:trk system potassium uptake protein TrkH
MLMGASPAGTGGGIKSTSVSAAFALLASVMARRREITFWSTRVPPHRVYNAFAGITLYLVTFAAGTFLLLLTETHPFEDVVFEAASAIGTVGLSRGLTPELTPVGKVIVTVMMYVGRVGPLTLAMAFAGGRPSEQSVEDLAV